MIPDDKDLSVFRLYNYNNLHAYDPPNKYYWHKAKPIRNSKENPKINRNALCVCGSGKKSKKCCNK